MGKEDLHMLYKHEAEKCSTLETQLKVIKQQLTEIKGF